jgi:anti-anti-sigma factor
MRTTITDLRADIAVLHLHGELDADTAPNLYRALANVVGRPVPRIVADLAGLRFCDSVGMSAFITSRQEAVDRGGWLSLAGANPFLQRLMQTVGLTRYFVMYPTVDAAITGSTVPQTA